MAINEKLKKIMPAITVIVLILLIISSSYFVGYRRGFANCVKGKKPDVIAQTGGIVQIYNSDPKDKPIFVGLKILRVGLGLVVDKK